MSPADPHWFPIGTAADDIAEVGDQFERAYGRAAEGVWAAPGRVNLMGEHVDYNAGHCLPFALPHRTYAAIGRRGDDLIQVRSGQIPEVSWAGRLTEVAPGNPPGWPAYPLGVVWAMSQSGSAVGGFDAMISSRVPLGAGLSSSAAIEGAVAVGVDELFDLGHPRTGLAQVCVRAENEIARAPTGGMDQSASLMAAAGQAMLLDCRDFSFTQIPFDLASAGAQILVMDTRAHHALTDGQYGSRRDECAEACARLGVATLRDFGDQTPDDELASALRVLGDDPGGERLRRRVRHIVTEMRRVHQVTSLLSGGAVADVLAEIGSLFDQSHRSMRDDYEISSVELDLAVSAARAAGALGARMTGGGFGGSAIALIHSTSRDEIAEAVRAAFADAGFTAPAFAVATPSAAAERVA